MFKRYMKRFDEKEYRFAFMDIRNGESWDEFLSLYARVFRPIVKEAFLWFDEGRHNHWGTLRGETGKLIAIYGLLSIRLNCGGKERDAFLCHNVGVDPDYAGKGLFQYIGEKSLDRLLSSETWVLGFPNKASVKGHKRLGWEEIGSVSLYTMGKKLPVKERQTGIGISEVSGFDETIDLFFDTVYPGFGLCVRKDSAYLNWRCAKPGNSYRRFILTGRDGICGYFILKEYRETALSKLHIVDIMAKQTEMLDMIFDYVSDIYQESAFDLCNLWLSDESDYALQALKNGFVKEEGSYPVILFSKEDGVPDFERKRMHFTLFDNDVY